MAKNAVLDVGTITIAGVVVKRWWRSKEVWNAILNTILSIVAGFIATAAFVAPFVLQYLNSLGLSPLRTLIILIVCKGVLELNQIVLKFQSTSVIGNKTDVQIARETTEAPDPIEHGDK